MEAIVTEAGHYPLYHMPPNACKLVPIPYGSRVTVRHPAADQDGWNAKPLPADDDGKKEIADKHTVCETMRYGLVVIPTANLEEVML